MKKIWFVGSSALLLGFLIFAGLILLIQQQPSEPVLIAVSAGSSESRSALTGGPQGFLFGRVTTIGDVTYEGRMRWGGDEEAFWNDYYNGFKLENQWSSQVPREQVAEKGRSIGLFGLKITSHDVKADLVRPFMARFGEIRRIDARDPTVRVTLESGTVVDLDRYSTGDFDDGVRIWDRDRGVVDVAPRYIRSIEFLPTASTVDVPSRLQGTVRTKQGDFHGSIQWNRMASVGTDELRGKTAEGPVRVSFDSIRSIAKHSSNCSRLTLVDGRELVLSKTQEAGHGHRGVYVHDPRYGRVLVSWKAFESVEFTAGGSGPARTELAAGRPLVGSVTLRGGRRLAGRMVFDLDESETTDTLDAPLQEVDFTIPFGTIRSIARPGPTEDQHVVVSLVSGEELRLEPSGDLGRSNAGLLVFEGEATHYVPWEDVERIELDPPAAP